MYIEQIKRISIKPVLNDSSLFTYELYIYAVLHDAATTLSLFIGATDK